MSSSKVTIYGFEYKAIGSTWSLYIPALSREEALQRVAAISGTAELRGTLVESLELPTGVTATVVKGRGFFRRLRNIVSFIGRRL